MNDKRIVLVFLLYLLTTVLFSQQEADKSYSPVINDPMYEPGHGPVIFIDEGHYNFHTKNGRYQPFARLLERDGYLVRSYEGTLKANHLQQGKILVISNALNVRNVNDWFLPNPSAFTTAEIEEVRNWVNDGGSLFLIADHMPMAGAAQELAAAFEFEFTNGFVMDTSSRGPISFKLADSTLISSRITRGRNSRENVECVVSFTGQAFNIPDAATPILIFGTGQLNLLPDTAWVFKKDTPGMDARGMSQGAFRRYGRGRVVAFGEAAMFTAQLAGSTKQKMGMNNPLASQNFQLLLNIIHWLDGRLE
jgi:hypothetical protein